MRPVLEVADIFRRHGPAYRLAHADHLGGTERRVMAVCGDGGFMMNSRRSAGMWNTAPTVD